MRTAPAQAAGHLLDETNRTTSSAKSIDKIPRQMKRRPLSTIWQNQIFCSLKTMNSIGDKGLSPLNPHGLSPQAPLECNQSFLEVGVLGASARCCQCTLTMHLDTPHQFSMFPYLIKANTKYRSVDSSAPVFNQSNSFYFDLWQNAVI